MTEGQKLALKYMPYTCPTLDKMAKEFAWRFTDHREENDFLAFIEEIKKEITCPMRTALEQVCEELVEVRSQNETLMYDQSINHE